MKIEIIDVDYQVDQEIPTLRDCGFRVGDIVEVIGYYDDGDISIPAIRETEFANIGDEISICEHEYRGVEK
ncbi:hypothetical protein bas03_0076 [Escherichia phage JulesPiccard]|uniref:Uncharacterized protein n=1 Tax=Escherichia phage JulesPiccard TaxID=2851956 RepID=A0AAE7VVH2_9CAUD|nr:hypothetical protein bas03_0076 [Escherichia phage JulesPiccard]